MKVNVEIYGKVETVEASDDFWLKMMSIIVMARQYSVEHGYSATARDYERLHDEIFEQTKDEIMKIKEN